MLTVNRAQYHAIQRMFASTQYFVQVAEYVFNNDEVDEAPRTILDRIPGETSCNQRLASYIRAIDDADLSSHLMTCFSIAMGDDLSQEEYLDLGDIIGEEESTDDANNLGAITPEMLRRFDNSELPSGMIVIPVSNALSKHTYPLGQAMVLFDTTDSAELYPESDQNIGPDERQAFHYTEVRPASKREAEDYVLDRFARENTPETEETDYNSELSDDEIDTLDDGSEVNSLGDLFGSLIGSAPTGEDQPSEPSDEDTEALGKLLPLLLLGAMAGAGKPDSTS